MLKYLFFFRVVTNSLSELTPASFTAACTDVSEETSEGATGAAA